MKALGLSILLALCAGLAPLGAQAVIKHYPLNIPRQPIDAALKDFAHQTGLQIARFTDMAGSGSVVGPLAGEYSLEDALKSLLGGSGFTYRVINERTIAIVEPGAASNGDAGSRPIARFDYVRPIGSARAQPAADSGGLRGRFALAQAESTGSSSQEDRQSSSQDTAAQDARSGEVLEEIIIRGARTSTATKMNAPVLEIPQNIQVLSAKFIEDIGADLLEDALRHVAGVAVGGYFNGWDYFRIRGFDGIVYLDGMRIERLNRLSLNTEIFGLERVEVLKGPSSTLYGDGLLSGMVNIVSKRPVPEAFFDTSFTAGNHDFGEATVDFGGALNEAQTLYARLPVLYREDGSFADFVDGQRRVYLAPSLTWDIGADTRLTVLTTYEENRNELAFPLPARGTVLPSIHGRIPLTRFAGDGNEPGTTHDENWAAGYQFTHRFSDALSFRQTVRQQRRETYWDRMIYPFFMYPDQRTLERFPYFIDDEVIENFNSDTGIELQFATGRIRHHMTVGVDFGHITAEAVESFNFDGGIPIDLFDPVNDGAAVIGDLTVSPYVEKSQALGFYLQNRIVFTDRLSLMLGGRYQKVDGGIAFGTTDADEVQQTGGDAFVPNLGFSYELVPGLHAYASYSESFKGQFASLNVRGGTAEPEEGVQYEVGLKAGLFDERLNGTFSVYELTRQNVLQPDPLNPGRNTLTGEQRSRGVELDGQFLLMPNWEVIASLAYTDAEVTNDLFIPLGSPLRNMPEHAFSLWSKYTFQDGVLQGLGVSLGGSYYGKQAGKDVAPPTPDPDDIESFYLPSYVLIGANLTYKWNKTRFALTFNNLLDERFFIGSYNENYVMPGSPRSVRLTVGWSY